MRARVHGGLKRLARFRDDPHGVAAVEFALLVPFLLLVYVGAVQLLDGIRVNRQVVMASSTVANVVSQYTTISAGTQMPDIMAASLQTLAPFPPERATIVVSSITIDRRGRASVAWSEAHNGTAREVGERVTLPDGLAAANSSVILGEARYRFTSIIDFLQLGEMTLTGSTYMVPRGGDAIALGQ